MLLLLSVSSKCRQKPGDVGFYEVVPLDCLLYDWLASRACRSGRANDYWLVCWWHCVERAVSDVGCSHLIYKICQGNVSYTDLEW